MNCSVDNCNNIIHAKGLCHKHYLQMSRHNKIFERTRFDVNDIIVKNDYAIINLYNRNNEVIALSFIDIEDIDKVKRYKWHLHSKGYVSNKNGELLHRLIMNVEDNTIILDHINQNKLDNRKSNLRVVSLSENTFNSKIYSTNTSGYRGIYFNKCANKWESGQ